MKVFTFFISLVTISSCFNDEKINQSNVSSLNFEQIPSPKIGKYEKDQLLNLRRHLLDPEKFSGILDDSRLSAACQSGLKEYLSSLHDFQTWALEMYDASAKTSSGLLSGNINNFGDFDECLNARSPSGTSGQYCLGYVKINVPDEMSLLNQLRKLSHSLETFQSNFTKGFDDLYHYAPIFSSFFWASCIPSSCDSVDFQQILQSQFNDVFNGTDVNVEIKTEQKLCQMDSQDVTLQTGSKAAICFFVALLVVIFFSTLLDAVTIEMDGKNSLLEDRILTSFSLTRNLKDLLSTEDASNDEIKSVHGVRFIAVLMIFISHKSFFAYFYPMANRTRIIQETFRGSTVPIRAGFLYTELFLMISGLLASHSLSKKMEKSKKINYLKEIIDRYLRIAPSLAVVILFLSHLLPLIGSGPLYKLLTEREAELCGRYWWRNLLLVNVWFGVRPMCAFHTQHVAIDFELFLVAPLLVALIYKWPKRGLQFIGVLAVISSLAKCYVTCQKNLSEFIIHGMTSQQLMDTGDYLYILPPYRFTSYAIGIFAGYCVKKARGVTSITSTQIYFLWGLLFSVLSISFRLSAELSKENYVYNPIHAAVLSFLPIPFCALFALAIFSAEMKISSFLTNVLEWKWFKVTTKLSYNFYLVQFVVFYYNTGSARGALFYNLLKTAVDLNELFFIISAAVLLTLCVELPVKNLRNSFFKGAKVVKEEQQPQKSVKLLAKKIE